MNVVGENFPIEITKQIDVRQNKMGLAQRDNQLLSWMNSKTSWVRMVSSVDVDKEVNPRNILDNLGGNGGENQLASNYVLFGGVTKYTPHSDSGAGVELRSGITTDGSVHNMGAYGLGGLDYGLSPMPGIQNANIKTETRGTLRTATINVKAYNKRQFDIIDLLYMRLGFTMLLEWGHTSYYDNNGELQTDISGKSTLESLFLTGLDKQGSSINYDTILPLINLRRKQFAGNYDAMLGKVVNFSWSIEPDLSYSITIILRSVGDVIESLKMNKSIGLINDSTSNKATSDSSPTPLEVFRNESIIGKKLYELIDKLESSDTIDDGEGGQKNIIAGKIPFKNKLEGKSPDNIYYVQLKHFLTLIKKYVIYDVKLGKTASKIIKFDLDEKTNIIHLHKRQIITDPTICVFNTSVNNPLSGISYDNISFPTNNVSYSLCSEWNEGEFIYNENRYLYLLNIYFNIDWLLKQMFNLVDKDGNLKILDVLNALCNGFSQSTCYFNKLTPTVNELNEITFIDEVALPDRDSILQLPDFNKENNYSNNLATFSLIGYLPNNGQKSSFIRKFSFKTEIPSSYATMISIGAQARGMVVGEDATCLSKMNYGLTDRMKSEIMEPTDDPLQHSNDISKFTLKFIGNLIRIKPIVDDFLTSTYSDTHKFNNDINNIGKDLIQIDQTLNTISSSLSHSSNDKKTNNYVSSPNFGFIPFNLQLEMDGLSGFKIYQKYTVEQEFLPTNYPESLDFIIKGISHNIANNTWTTTIESLGMPKSPGGSGNGNLNISINDMKSTNTSNIIKLNAIETIISNVEVAASITNTPRLRKAVLDQSSFVYNKFGEDKSNCGKYTFSIAKNLKKYLDTNSTKAIPLDSIGGSGGDTNSDLFREGIMNLGIYDQNYLGSYTASTLKAGYFNKFGWNYGDILNYYSPGNSPKHNMHAQIYTGNIWSPSNWSTDQKNNYGSNFIYKSTNMLFNVYVFKIKKEYLV